VCFFTFILELVFHLQYCELSSYACVFRFKKVLIKECIHNVVTKTLQGKVYDAEDIPNWTKTISNEIKSQLKGENNAEFGIDCHVITTLLML